MLKEYASHDGTSAKPITVSSSMRHVMCSATEIAAFFYRDQTTELPRVIVLALKLAQNTSMHSVGT